MQAAPLQTITSTRTHTVYCSHCLGEAHLIGPLPLRFVVDWLSSASLFQWVLTRLFKQSYPAKEATHKQKSREILLNSPDEKGKTFILIILSSLLLSSKQNDTRMVILETVRKKKLLWFLRCILDPMICCTANNGWHLNMLECFLFSFNSIQNILINLSCSEYPAQICVNCHYYPTTEHQNNYLQIWYVTLFCKLICICVLTGHAPSLM